MFRHRVVAEDEPLADPDFIALKKSLETLRPIREHRLRSAERELFREKKKLATIDSEIEAAAARIDAQNQAEAEQRQALSTKNQARSLSLQDLQNWMGAERSLIRASAEATAERERIVQQKQEQQQKIEQANRQMLSRHRETEKLKMMLEQITQD